MGSWPKEMTEDLRHLWEVLGASASVCARRLNAKHGTKITRNAIVGKVHRLGLLGRRTKERIARTGGPKGPWAERRRLQHAANISDIRKTLDRINNPSKQPEPDHRPIREALVVPENERKDLLDLEHGDCRYAYGDAPPFTFCARKTVPGASYCHAHFELCFTSARVARETETSDPKISDNSTPASERVKENA